MTADRLRARIVAVTLAVLTLSGAVQAAAAVPGGTPIKNVATATFESNRGDVLSVVSNAVTTVTAQIGAVVVAPKQAAAVPSVDSFGSGAPVVRVFTITNSSNIADAYTITDLTTGAGRIASAAFGSASGAPVIVGSSVTPLLQPGASMQVFVTVATAGVAPGTAFPIRLSARSTATTTVNGLQTDSGTLWALAGTPAKIQGADGSPVIQKSVQGAVSTAAVPGSTIAYDITFKNGGGSPANNTVVSDRLPAGVSLVAGSVRVNGNDATASARFDGRTLTVSLGAVPAGASEDIAFSATVSPALTSGSTAVNTATVSADGLVPVVTSAASIVSGFSNIVYDGYDGQKHPILGAVVTVVDPKTGLPLVFAPLSPLVVVGSSARSPLAAGGNGSNVNTANANPFTTGADGAFSFVFGPDQVGTAAAPATYDVLISAPSYLNRRLRIAVAAGSVAPLYSVALTALDGEPVAVAGGFALNASAGANMTDVFGLLGNQPLFKPQPVTIAKTADRSSASAGDRIVFTLDYGAGGNAYTATTITDTLPPGLAYAAGSARVDGARSEPDVSGRSLVWHFPALTDTHRIVYATVVAPSARESATLTNTVDISAASANAGGAAHAAARADVAIVPGVFTKRLVITGRVYADAANAGRFVRGAAGVPGVRVFLEDGEYAITDAKGRYSFPSVRPGMHALRLDPSTFPAGLTGFGRSADGDRSEERLVHGIMDASLMHDLNFALQVVAK